MFKRVKGIPEFYTLITEERKFNDVTLILNLLKFIPLALFRPIVKRVNAISFAIEFVKKIDSAWLEIPYSPVSLSRESNFAKKIRFGRLYTEQLDAACQLFR